MTTLHAEDAGDPATMILTGYVVVTAGDFDEAVRVAQGCPGLKTGITVEVAEPVQA